MEEGDLEQFTGESCDWTDLPCHLSGFAEWLLDAMLFIPRKTFQLILEALAGIIEAIPVPDFFAQAGSGLGNIPAYTMFFAEFAQIPEGIAIILSAYTIRFLIRRIPLVG